MSTCLVIIDVQNGFINKSTEHIPNSIKNLLCKQFFDYVVCTKFINKESSAFTDIMNWYDLMDKSSQKLNKIIESVSEKVFEKNSYSCFTEEFEEYIKDNGIDKLYFVGIDTDACVLKSALDCFERNIKFEVLTNYCASTGGKEIHEAAIKIMDRNISSNCVNKKM